MNDIYTHTPTVPEINDALGAEYHSYYEISPKDIGDIVWREGWKFLPNVDRTPEYTSSVIATDEITGMQTVVITAADRALEIAQSRLAALERIEDEMRNKQLRSVQALWANMNRRPDGLTHLSRHMTLVPSKRIARRGREETAYELRMWKETDHPWVRSLNGFKVKPVTAEKVMDRVPALDDASVPYPVKVAVNSHLKDPDKLVASIAMEEERRSRLSFKLGESFKSFGGGIVNRLTSVVDGRMTQSIENQVKTLKGYMAFRKANKFPFWESETGRSMWRLGNAMTLGYLAEKRDRDMWKQRTADGRRAA